MKISIFGATRGVGAELLRQATQAGHQCRVLARNPADVIPGPGVEIVEGNVLDPAAVARTLTGTEVVAVCLGGTANNPPTVCSQGTRHILDAMREQGQKRVVVVTSMGLGDSVKQIPWQFRIALKTVLKSVMHDKSLQEAMIQDSGLDWTIVRPGGLIDGEVTGTYRTGTDTKTTGGRVRRSDVAHFVLAQLSGDNYLRQTPYIT